jgi:hypothetical protein
MPKIGKTQASQIETMDGFEGRYEDLAGYTAGFESYSADSDPAPLFAGLPDDHCQCPHWGMVLRGTLIYNYADGTQDRVEAGEAYYAPPGHLPVFTADTEIVEFSPTDELAATIERHAIGRVVLDASAAWDLGKAKGTSATTGRGVVIVGDGDGAVLAARWFPPNVPTPIHDHGTWGVAVVATGYQLYERWEPTAAGHARLTEEVELAEGDIATWAAPPHDVHRQQGIHGGSLELLVLGSPPHDSGVFGAEDPLDRAAEALRVYDLASLRQLYAADIVLDANTPEWRYQLQGRDTVADQLTGELAGLEARVVASRVTRAPSVRVVEIEAHAGTHPDEHLWREIHILRGGRDGISEHVIQCTGVWNPETIARHAAEAPMVWR